MTATESVSYEKIYYSLWEAARRYSSFTQFRVIGSSHDERMIPMLEIGSGAETVFCLSGVTGTDRHTPRLLVEMALEYCRAIECGWILEDFYEVKKILEKVSLCLIPVLNPDGFEICGKGYSAVRNPIFRQMLKMQNTPYGEFACNARGMDIAGNFPTVYYTRKWAGQEPASENETKALIHIFQEYRSLGLLSFCQAGKKIVCCRSQGFSHNQKSYRLARHLQKLSEYKLEKQPLEAGKALGKRSTGSPEQFYTETVRQPALMIETSEISGEEEGEEWKRAYQKLHLLPLEYIFSI